MRDFCVFRAHDNARHAYTSYPALKTPTSGSIRAAGELLLWGMEQQRVSESGETLSAHTDKTGVRQDFGALTWR